MHGVTNRFDSGSDEAISSGAEQYSSSSSTASSASLQCDLMTLMHSTPVACYLRRVEHTASSLIGHWSIAVTDALHCTAAPYCTVSSDRSVDSAMHSIYSDAMHTHSCMSRVIDCDHHITHMSCSTYILRVSKVMTMPVAVSGTDTSDSHQ